MTTTDTDGATTSELFCNVTNLLDPSEAPIEDIPAVYHQRWTGETMLDAVKTELRSGSDVLLRSQSPDRVHQEMWALFCLSQGLADVIGDAARHHRTDPDPDPDQLPTRPQRRPPFRPPDPGGFPPQRLHRAREHAWTELGRRTHDRPGRSSPRATKRPTHRYPTHGDEPASRRVPTRSPCTASSPYQPRSTKEAPLASGLALRPRLDRVDGAFERVQESRLET